MDDYRKGAELYILSVSNVSHSTAQQLSYRLTVTEGDSGIVSCESLDRQAKTEEHHCIGNRIRNSNTGMGKEAARANVGIF